MTAPAGVNSGSAPEPAARETADSQAAGAEAAQPTLAAAVPPQAAEPALEAAITEDPEAAKPTTDDPAGEPDDESAVGVADRDPGPADGEPAVRAGRGRGRRLLAVAATVVAILALVGVAVAVLDVATHGFRPKTVVTYREAAVFRLRAGECVNSSPNGLSVTIQSCATPHDAEVFATFGLTGSSWPGGAAIQQDASNGCMSRVPGYLNPQLVTASFTQEYVFPDQQAWQGGVRTVVCEIRASSGQLTGSVRQAG